MPFRIDRFIDPHEPGKTKTSLSGQKVSGYCKASANIYRMIISAGCGVIVQSVRGPGRHRFYRTSSGLRNIKEERERAWTEGD